MGKYDEERITEHAFWFKQIANELAEQNRLKRAEIRINLQVTAQLHGTKISTGKEIDEFLEDQA